MKLRRSLAPLLAALLVLGACASHQVTTSNSPQGKIGVYATKVIESTKTVTDAVKTLEANQTIPTNQAAAVIKTAVEIDKGGERLADLLQIYSTLVPGSDDSKTTLDKIQQELNAISAAASTLLVPIDNTAARQQLAQLAATINQTLVTLATELAKGVR